MSKDHAVYEQLAAGHAFSALEPEDEQVFLAHLHECAACSNALSRHSDTLGHLAYDAPAYDPPQSVLAGIRAGIRAEGDAVPPLAPPTSLAAVRERRAARTVRLSTALVGVAAALVLVVSLVFVNRGLTSQDHSQQLSAAAVNKAVAQLLVPGARAVTLHGAGTAVAVINGDRISLVMSGVAVNDTTNSVYVLWGKSRFGGVRAVGTFDVSTNQLVVVNSLHLVNPSTLQSLIVTRENGRTPPAVTTQRPVVSGDA
jgi:hypothetical protein